MRGFQPQWRFKDMAIFGADFKRAKREWLFPAEKTQGVLRATLLAVLLMVVYQVLQAIVAIAIFYYGFGGDFLDIGVAPGDTANFYKSAVLGLAPSVIPIVILAIYLAQFGLPNRQGKLLWRWPDLGWGGWVVTLLMFVLLAFLFFIVLFAVLGIDPRTYSPSGGIGDKDSQAGIVEKVMAELSSQPKLFIFVALSAVIAAPVVEEILFRGAFFAALVTSPVGKWGAVLITAALFALMHATSDQWPIVGVLFFMGIMLGLLMLRFGSLWVPIAAHALWNGIQVLGAYFGTVPSS
jgi:membrane protease YdiL (CAAX protease family)